MKIHIFKTSEKAYNATMCDEKVNLGDLLVIPSEDVIGVANVWPFAITEKSGSLETLKTEQSFKKQLILTPELIEAYLLYESLREPGKVYIK